MGLFAAKCKVTDWSPVFVTKRAHSLLPSFTGFSMVQFPYTFEYLFKAIRNLTKLNTLMLYNASEAFILKLIAESAVGYNDSFREKFLDMFSDGKGYDLTLDQM